MSLSEDLWIGTPGQTIIDSDVDKIRKAVRELKKEKKFQEIFDDFADEYDIRGLSYGRRSEVLNDRINAALNQLIDFIFGKELV